MKYFFIIYIIIIYIYSTYDTVSSRHTHSMDEDLVLATESNRFSIDKNRFSP